MLINRTTLLDVHVNLFNLLQLLVTIIIHQVNLLE